MLVPTSTNPPPSGRSSCLVLDKVSWSDRAAAHNRLVVGSSPTSSTTQSRATGESGLVQNAPFLIDAREGARGAAQLILANRRTPALIRIPTASPQHRFSASGKPNFTARDRGDKNGGADRTSFRQRPKLIVVRHCSDSNHVPDSRSGWRSCPASAAPDLDTARAHDGPQ